jgi:hypothetical protein
MNTTFLKGIGASALGPDLDALGEAHEERARKADAGR